MIFEIERETLILGETDLRPVTIIPGDKMVYINHFNEDIILVMFEGNKYYMNANCRICNIENPLIGLAK